MSHGHATIGGVMFDKLGAFGRVVFAFFLCAAWGCGGGGGSDGNGSSALAQGVVGAAGGQIAVTDSASPHTGVVLELAAGAVAADTRIEIRLSELDPELPSPIFAYSIEPSDLRFAPGSATLTIRYSTLYSVITPVLEPRILSRAGGDGAAITVLDTLRADSSERTVTASIEQLGKFMVLNGSLHALFTQLPRLIDPSEPAQQKELDDSAILTAGPGQNVQVGQGSLESFFASPSANNLLVMHGLLSSPLEFLGMDDIADELAADYDNIVLFQYPTGRSIASNANDLYDLFATRGAAGFGCDIVAHSMGGLVARYMIERSHRDPMRPSFGAGAPSAEVWVDHLITLGTPHAGARIPNALLDIILTVLPSTEDEYVRGVTDLQLGSNSFTSDLNANYVNNATEYHFIAGDLGIGSDGVVSVGSATEAIPLALPESAIVLATPLATHTALHADAGLLGVPDLIRGWTSNP